VRAVHIPEAFSTGPIGDVVAEASGREARHDPVLPRTGGPAGNAVLTAWTGLVVLVLGVAELLTLFDVRGLISWHVALGALLVPPALLKTGSTGWRLVRYYLGHRSYIAAGPPVLLLRLLGPLVVVSTLGLLGTGVVLILIGEATGRSELVTLLGFRVDWITLHQGAFLVWAVATGLHLLARIVPAIRLTIVARRGRRVPGGPSRTVAVGVALVLATVLAVALVNVDGSWGREDFRRARFEH
jgi:hypothetical protein